jgi:hypothetical protein
MNHGSKLSAHPGKPKALACAAFLALITSQNTFAAITLSEVSGIVSAGAQGALTKSIEYSPQTGVIADSATSQTTASGSYNYATSRIFANSPGPEYGGSSFAAGAANTFGNIRKDITFQATQTGNYSLTTYLYGGYLESSIAGVATGFGKATYNWGVSVGGIEVLASGVSAKFDSSGISQVTTSGTALAGFSESMTASGAYASWSGTSLTTQLGLLQANDSVNISFYMATFAASTYQFNSSSNPSGYGSCGSTFFPAVELNVSGCGSSRVSFGDPLSINGGVNEGQTNLAFGNAVLNFEPVVSAVPEPGEWAMMLSGLIVVSAIAKKKRKQVQA